MEHWKEENLLKLSVKELKSMARKSNLNPNFKKADLVKMLLNVDNSKDPPQEKNNEIGTSRRVTRSRVSTYQTLNEKSGSVPNSEPKAKMKVVDDCLKAEGKEPENESRIKRINKACFKNIETYNISEMFPLVSSIQGLISKPLLEITNKDVVGKEQRNEPSRSLTSKRSKCSKAQSNNKEPYNDKITDEISLPVNSTYNSSETLEQENNNLNGTFIVEDKGGQDIKRDNKKRKTVENVSGVEDKNLYLPDQVDKNLSVTECNVLLKDVLNVNKRKPRPDTENMVINEKRIKTKKIVRRRKQNNVKGEGLNKGKHTADTSNSEQSSEIIVKSPVTVDSEEINWENSFSDNEIVDSKFKERPDISSSKTSMDSLKDENLTVTECIVLLEDVLNKSSELCKTVLNPQKESTISVSSIQDNTVKCMSRGSVNKLLSPQQKSLNESKTNDGDTSTIKEAEEMPVAGPSRMSTFVLSKKPRPNDNRDDGVTQKHKFLLKRRNTFIIEDNGAQSPERRSLQFSPGSAFEKKATSNQAAFKLGQSIGSKIMQNSMKKSGNEKIAKKDTGSMLKKTVSKNSTSGSVFKKRPASKIKMPDFKKIHEHLFRDMESLSDNKKRQMSRAQNLLQSPVVPRCALLTPNPKTPKNGTLIKGVGGHVQSPINPSPLARRLESPLVILKPVPIPPSVNRFGFRKIIKKEEANARIGSKLPTANIQKRKEQQRNMLQGVRMNKRFMLQMQMRHNKGIEK